MLRRTDLGRSSALADTERCTAASSGVGDPRGDPGRGLLGPLRDRLRVRVRPPVPKEPSETFIKILVPQAVPKGNDKRSDELVGPEGMLEVLVVGIGPSITRNESSMAGQFTPAHSMDGAVARCSVPPMAEQFNRGYMRNAAFAHRPTIQPKASFFGNQEESKGFWSFDTWKSQWNGWKKKYYTGRDIIEKLGMGPGIFKDIGCEARGLLADDYMANTLKTRATSNDDGISLALGMTMLDEDSVTKFLFDGKYLNSSMSLNATRTQNEDDIFRTVASEIIFHNIMGPSTNAYLYIPYPYANEEIEVRSLLRFAGVTGHIRPGAPHVQGSCLFGTHLFAFGGMLLINTEDLGVDFSVGATARTSDLSVGLVMGKVEGVTSVEATLFRTLENELTSLGVIASHSSVNLPWYERTSLTIGASHAFPSQDLILKGRFSSRGIGSVLAKKSFFEKFSLVLSSEFDYNRVQQNLQEGLKCGIIFSIP